MHGSWCHLWPICVSSHDWKVPFLTLAFLGLLSVIWLSTDVYLSSLFEQLQPICSGRRLLSLSYQCPSQKAVEEDDSVCSAATSYNNPVCPSAVVLHRQKKRGQGLFSSLHHCWHSDIKWSFMPVWELGHQYMSLMFHMFIDESSSSSCSLSSQSLGKNAFRSSSLCTFPPLPYVA